MRYRTSSRPAVILAWLLAVALFFAAPHVFVVAFAVLAATLVFLLTTPAGAVLLGAALAVTLLRLLATSIHRPVFGRGGWVW